MTAFSLKRLRELIHRPAEDHLDGLSWYFHRAEYWVFTRRYSLDFDGFIPREELVTDAAESLANSNNYRAYTNFHLRKLLHEAMRLGIRFESFVDVGCGKGLPCIFARKYFDFENVYGIDFSPPLIEVASRNASRAPYDNVQFLVADATTWQIPDANSLVLINNPFNGVILAKFVENNIGHFARYRSIIAYGNDYFRSTLCSLGFEVIYRSNRHQQSLLRYTGSPAG